MRKPASGSETVSSSVSLSEADKKLIAEIQGGLPLVSRPYEVIGKKLGLSEQQVIQQIQLFLEKGLIKRMGVVVRHHELGYRANAMVVWDIADEKVAELAPCMGKFEFVNLCYRRPRHLPQWRYNLFTMIHGHDRDEVMNNLKFLIEQCGLEDTVHEALFSIKRFKQRGALYQPQPTS
ncbi:MAG: AsnC family protein [Gammaproteobacteria bacterium]|nr:AsnC family protein [Gammaproteobacteria bacterium]